MQNKFELRIEHEFELIMENEFKLMIESELNSKFMVSTITNFLNTQFSSYCHFYICYWQHVKKNAVWSFVEFCWTVLKLCPTKMCAIFWTTLETFWTLWFEIIKDYLLTQSYLMTLSADKATTHYQSSHCREAQSRVLHWIVSLVIL